jgi:hypothetical protein
VSAVLQRGNKVSGPSGLRLLCYAEEQCLWQCEKGFELKSVAGGDICKIGERASKYGGCTVFRKGMEKETRNISVHTAKY